MLLHELLEVRSVRAVELGDLLALLHMTTTSSSDTMSKRVEQAADDAKRLQSHPEEEEARLAAPVVLDAVDLERHVELRCRAPGDA